MVLKTVRVKRCKDCNVKIVEKKRTKKPFCVDCSKKHNQGTIKRAKANYRITHAEEIKKYHNKYYFKKRGTIKELTQGKKCEDCGIDISTYRSLAKKFCDKCIVAHSRESSKIYISNHKEERNRKHRIWMKKKREANSR